MAPLEAEPEKVEPLSGGGHPGFLLGQGEPKLAQQLGESGTQPRCHWLGRHDEDVVGLCRPPDYADLFDELVVV
jgi:hypothetical protein